MIVKPKLELIFQSMSLNNWYVSKYRFQLITHPNLPHKQEMHPVTRYHFLDRSV